MKKIIVNGGQKLTGTIKVSGMKNSVVALIPAAILCDEEVSIYNVPNISDTKSLIDIVKLLNGKVNYFDETMNIDTSKIQNVIISEEYSNKLRASYYFMGALLSRFKKVEMYFPGGCKIGARPINFHLKGFESLGAKVTVDKDRYIIEANKLIGTTIFLDFASVGATINLMLAATKAEGTTIINNAAKEPEIVNIATFLNNMGAKISGAGTSTIKIVGVEKLHKAIIDVIPDRIEAGTYMIAGALAGKDLIVDGVIQQHLGALIMKLSEMGVKLEVEQSSVKINSVDNLKPINLKSLVFPGFPTDLGQPISVLLTQANGKSKFEETIYENRFGHIDYLNKMGANIKREETTVYIEGPTPLKGTSVVATDLRAGAAMILAGLIAEGTTEVNEVEHILRGYENIVEKLSSVGAKIKIEE